MATVITGGLITLEDARDAVFNDPARADAARDATLTLYVKAVTPIIESIAGPVRAMSASCIRTITPSGAVLLPWEGATLTEVKVDGVVVTTGVHDSRNGIIRGLAGEYAEVTATIGPASVAENVQIAARELVRVFWQQGRQGNRPAIGNPADTDTLTLDESAIPRRVYQLLRPNRPVGGFA